MKRLILIATMAVAGTMAACGPGTDVDVDVETFPLESVPVESLVPGDLPSVEPSVDASMEPTASPS